MSRISQRFQEPQLAILTPEHVPVHFTIADIGSRAVAVLLDLGIQFAVGFLLLFGLGVLFSLGGDVTLAIGFISFFLIRNFYFTFLELRWHGRTVGKRALGLRVVARDGGPLTADLVFARNLTREIETFLPLSALLAPQALLGGAPGWAQLVTFLWIMALTLLPLFNRQRARLGDLLAGTVVVREPKAQLLDDLVEEAQELRVAGEYTFTTEELDIYGETELQVLEDLLRRPYTLDTKTLLMQVSRKILRKIGRDPRQEIEPARFLRSFYAAQRARLEGRLLLGQRRERKVR